MYKIVKAECLADKIYLMDVEAPRVARACQPGEFVIVKMDEAGERIPLTICDSTGRRGLLPLYSRQWALPPSVWQALRPGIISRILWDLWASLPSSLRKTWKK